MINHQNMNKYQWMVYRYFTQLKESFEICDYNLKWFMSLGWTTDDIIMNLFLNQSNEK